MPHRRAIRTTATGAVLVALLTAALASATPPAAAAPEREVRPLVGANPADAARLSAEAVGHVGTAVLVRADDPADALAATYVARTVQGVILFTRRDAIPAETDAALRSINATHVVVVGGPAAIGPRAVTALLSRGLAVERLSGATRYETAQLAAEADGGTTIGVVDGHRTALLAGGSAFADAVAAGPVAYAAALPVLLTHPTVVPEPTRLALADLAITRVVVVGGPTVVADAVLEQLRAAGLTVERLAGPDRGATSVAVADWAVRHLGFSRRRVAIVRGDDLATGLAYAPLAGRLRTAAGPPGPDGAEVAPNALLLSSAADDLGEEVWTFARRAGSLLGEVDLLGTEAQDPTAVHRAFVTAITAAAPVVPPASVAVVTPAEPVARPSSVRADGGPAGRQGVVAFSVSGLAPATYDLILAPCAAIDTTGPEPVFSDRDADGVADGTRLPGPGVGPPDVAATDAFVRTVNGLIVSSSHDEFVADISTTGTVTFELDHLVAGPTCSRPVLVQDRGTDAVDLVAGTGRSARPVVVGPPVSWIGPAPTPPR